MLPAYTYISMFGSVLGAQALIHRLCTSLNLFTKFNRERELAGRVSHFCGLQEVELNPVVRTRDHMKYSYLPAGQVANVTRDGNILAT